jgi:hypothetical protein
VEAFSPIWAEIASPGRFALRHWLVIVLVVLVAIFEAQNRDRHRGSF